MAGRKRAGVALDLRKADATATHDLEPAGMSGSGKRMRLSDQLYGQIFEQIGGWFFKGLAHC